MIKGKLLHKDIVKMPKNNQFTVRSTLFSKIFLTKNLNSDFLSLKIYVYNKKLVPIDLQHIKQQMIFNIMIIILNLSISIRIIMKIMIQIHN
jgi:hypothetical protein